MPNQQATFYLDGAFGTVQLGAGRTNASGTATVLYRERNTGTPELRPASGRHVLVVADPATAGRSQPPPAASGGSLTYLGVLGVLLALLGVWGSYGYVFYQLARVART